MKVTSLLVKNNRVQVFIDNNYSFSCTQNFAVSNLLFTDKEVTFDEVVVLKNRAQYSIVEYKLFEYASRGVYSRRELENKISSYCYKKFNFLPDQDFYDKSFQKAIDLHLFDPELVVKILIEKYISRGKGKNYINSKLISKGFEKDLITKGLGNVNEKKVGDNLNIVLSKKYESLSKKESDKYKLKQKLIKYALSRGYSYQEVKEVLDEIL